MSHKETTSDSTTLPRPGAGLKTEKMPGHWVLARLGKLVNFMFTRLLPPSATYQTAHQLSFYDFDQQQVSNGRARQEKKEAQR
jgi:hypothetical protein